MEFKQVLEEKKALVWPEIEKYLDGFLKFPKFCHLDKKYQSLIDFHKIIVSDYPQRQGKYVRPTLLMLTAEAMGMMWCLHRTMLLIPKRRLRGLWPRQWRILMSF